VLSVLLSAYSTDCDCAVIGCCSCGCRSKLAAVRLQNYWNKVCDDEKRSRLRNEQLLHEFDELETRARELEENIAQLTAVKVCTVSCLINFHVRVFINEIR